MTYGKTSIYDAANPDGEDWLPKEKLEELLNIKLVGLDLSSYAIRTRSKVVKTAICEALGYPVPALFKKTQPRFPAQDLDVYTQKNNNLQIWNEEISPNRRYALVRPDESGIIKCVRVVTGEDLIPLDKTGTLTKKYQAAYRNALTKSVLLSSDSEVAKTWVGPRCIVKGHPTDLPSKGNLISIEMLFECLCGLVGSTIEHEGIDQERLRGAALHTAVCQSLGYGNYLDKGSFPDLPNQLLEIKLQTSPTIDLGLVLPTSDHLVAGMEKLRISHQDVRYAIFYGTRQGTKVHLDYLLLCSGQSFFNHFSQFEGLKVNAKIQIPLPRNFFPI